MKEIMTFFVLFVFGMLVMGVFSPAEAMQRCPMVWAPPGVMIPVCPPGVMLPPPIYPDIGREVRGRPYYNNQPRYYYNPSRHPRRMSERHYRYNHRRPYNPQPRHHQPPPRRPHGGQPGRY